MQDGGRYTILKIKKKLCRGNHVTDGHKIWHDDAHCACDHYRQSTFCIENQDGGLPLF